ncbi:MAG: zinc ribbon domain-containing protein [Ruminococcus sp.]|nr:zinc ribbon domain-containing protein [Ruminococcus sp.]
MYCKYCGAVRDPYLKFCTKCGREQQMDYNTQLHCKFCGELISESQQFCHNCGREQNLLEQSADGLVAYNYKENKVPVIVTLILCTLVMVAPFINMFSFDFTTLDIDKKAGFSFVSISDVGSDITAKNISGNRDIEGDTARSTYPRDKLSEKYGISLESTDIQKVDMSPAIVTVITVFYILTVLAYFAALIALVVAFAQLAPNDSDDNRLYNCARSSAAFVLMGNLLQLIFAIIINRSFISVIESMKDDGIKIDAEPLIRMSPMLIVFSVGAIIAYVVASLFLKKGQKYYKVKYFGRKANKGVQ